MRMITSDKNLYPELRKIKKWTYNFLSEVSEIPVQINRKTTANWLYVC